MGFNVLICIFFLYMFWRGVGSKCSFFQIRMKIDKEVLLSKLGAMDPALSEIARFSKHMRIWKNIIF